MNIMSNFGIIKQLLPS